MIRMLAMVPVLAVITSLIVVTGSHMLVLLAHNQEIQQRAGQSQAKGISTSGVHHALTFLDANPVFTGTYAVALPGGAGRITVTDWTNDGVDNDNLNGVDDGGEANILEILSEGWVNPQFISGADPLAGGGFAAGVPDPEADPSVRRWSAVTQVLTRRQVVNIPVTQALYIDDPLAILNISGNAFLFTGFDTNIDGTPSGSGVVLPGIGVPGDPALLIAQIRANQTDNVIGDGPDPSIVQVPAADLDDMVNNLGSMASLVWPAATSYDGTIGTAAAPIIAHAEATSPCTATCPEPGS